MRRFLLTAAAASLVMLAACTDAVPGARAVSGDGGQARVHLLSGAEVVASSLRHDAAQTSRDAPACAVNTALESQTRTEARNPDHATVCNPGTED